jgi:hypothetical protein
MNHLHPAGLPVSSFKNRELGIKKQSAYFSLPSRIPHLPSFDVLLTLTRG